METRITGNKVIIIFVLILMCVMIMYPFGAGIIYPKKFFSFQNKNKNFYWGAADKACDIASELTPEINVLFRQAGNSFKADFFPIFLTKKNYTKLYIEAISYIYEEECIIVLKDAVFLLPSQIVKVGSNKSGWITNGSYYWLNGWDAKPCGDKFSEWPSVNFEKIFKNKKIGDEFSFFVEIVYKFDDENEKLLMIPFSVKTLKGTFTSPFAGS